MCVCTVRKYDAQWVYSLYSGMWACHKKKTLEHPPFFPNDFNWLQNYIKIVATVRLSCTEIAKLLSLILYASFMRIMCWIECPFSCNHTYSVLIHSYDLMRENPRENMSSFDSIVHYGLRLAQNANNVPIVSVQLFTLRLIHLRGAVWQYKIAVCKLSYDNHRKPTYLCYRIPPRSETTSTL